MSLGHDGQRVIERNSYQLLVGAFRPVGNFSRSTQRYSTWLDDWHVAKITVSWRWYVMRSVSCDASRESSPDSSHDSFITHKHATLSSYSRVSSWVFTKTGIYNVLTHARITSCYNYRAIWWGGHVGYIAGCVYVSWFYIGMHCRDMEINTWVVLTFITLRSGQRANILIYRLCVHLIS